MSQRGARLRLGAGVALVACAAGGVAYAAIPDSNGVIHSCYQKNVGNLRVVDTEAGQACRPSEEPLDLNVSGTPGPSGTTGPQGPTGPPGPAGGGAPGVWDATASASIAQQGSATIVSLSLPAGNYFVVAKASIFGGGGYTCRLLADGTTVDTSLTTANALASPSVQSAVTLAADGTVSLRCDSTTNAASVTGHIDAIQAGTIQ